MKKTGLILATMLLALCVLGLVSPAQGNALPKISLEINGVPVTTLNIRVCSEFTLDLWIRDIPLGYSMVYFIILIDWDSNLIELVNVDPIEPPGWTFTAGGKWTGPPWTEDAVWARFTFHCLGEGTGLMVLTSPIIVLQDPDENPYDTEPEPFEFTVHQYRAVGGVLTGTDKLAVLSPYLALIGLVGAVTVAVAVQRRRKP